jgi:hypothetical protein
MSLIVWIIIILGAGSIAGYFIFKYFKNEWKPYVALTKQVINLLKFFINSFDSDPTTLSTMEIFMDILERSFKVFEDILKDQDVISGMAIEGQISYIRSKIQLGVDDYLEKNHITLSEEDQQAIITVMNIMDFFLKLLLPKL